MKFLSTALCLSISSVVLADWDDNAHRALYGYEDACIKSHKISLDGGVCNFEAITEIMQENINGDDACKQGTNATNELRALFMDEALEHDDIVEIITEACEEAFYGLMYGGQKLDYIDILDDSQQMVKEYFDGRGAVNSEFEYERAIGLGETIVSRVPIQWPGDACFEYEKQIPKQLHSQFPHDHFKKMHTHKVTTNYYGHKTVYDDGHGNKVLKNYYPVQNFDQCELNTAMCCWTESTDASRVYGHQPTRKTTEHNTDVCYVNMADAPTSSRVRAGFAIFPGLSEVKSGQGSVRCHGFSWAEDPVHFTNLFKGNALFEASFQKHLERGGYISSISGAPMCGCLEQMPVVTRADCTQVNVADFSVEVEITKGCIEVKIPDSNKITFSPCTADPDPVGSDRKLQDNSTDPVPTNLTNSTDAVSDPAVDTNATETNATNTNATNTNATDKNTTDVTSEPYSDDTEAAAPVATNVIDLRAHYELMVAKKMVPDKKNKVAKRLVGEGGCTEIVAEFFDDNGIHGYR